MTSDSRHGIACALLDDTRLSAVFCSLVSMKLVRVKGGGKTTRVDIIASDNHFVTA